MSIRHSLQYYNPRIASVNALEDLLRKIIGTVFGDKCYISKRLKELLSDKSINLVTRVSKNMKPQELPQELDTKLKNAHLLNRFLVF